MSNYDETETSKTFEVDYKMLVLDLDDTLLRDDHSISSRNKKLLTEAQEKGVKVVLASGRPTQAMLQYAEELQLASFDSYLISFNGAVVTSMKNNEILFQKNLTRDEIHSLYDFSITNNVHIITYSNKGIVSETDSEYIDVELNLTGIPHHKVPSFKSEITGSAVKCILLEDPSFLRQVEKKLKAERTDLSVARSKPFFLEVMPHGIDKAASIDFLAKKLDIEQHEVIAVGNAGNDLSMIQYAGLGVWVDNVTPELRHEADVIVASNNNDGVAEVVERFILK
ncbi:Cof-like hydrolase [Paludibacter propionicigenes WB4]|uniref:Cof-like hydrolase n=1 Tax=Paludibacter propionicigenes (strain DSM 17365 / JCM 13257 / WB4) TaxID=694427 RepID=E4T699_PALPW|nr:Cof-type HAD-IIB family hydrolase [Paludibacter propionicigenes]ADQ80243.1 Cof-like hydrolase [Paludibacter propionicigenes WB4]